MIITDKKIRELVENKSLIAPFCEEKLQSESYDVTLGNSAIVLKKDVHCLDINDPTSIDDIYEEVSLLEDGYIVSPKEYIMVTLEETINLPDNLSAHVRPKTRYNRLGLLVSSQHCNSSYSGILRIGIFNATDYPIRIRAGYTIAQLVFEELNEPASDNKLYRNKIDSHYQNESNQFVGAKFDDAFINNLLKEILK